MLNGHSHVQVHPWKIPPPSGTILTPSAHALHNLAHIELNAIDLAWDTVVRFSGATEELNGQFFGDFAHVADDESRHFLWCLQRLAEMGFRYGVFREGKCVSDGVVFFVASVI